ncbi:hypothetical protein Tco_1132259 [Tanacetum coccineum]|uniref:Uncharacterized protein n=1 Tax=Tanacetum coccineum TaxID=301880 RepID=A0ABQ5JBG9_9ASTR
MERGFLTSASKEKGIDGGSKANSVLSGLTTKIRNIDRKIIVKDSTQRKAIRCVQADPVLDVIANAAMDKDHAEGPPLKSILKRPNVASNMAVMNAATEVLVKDLQHDVNSGPDSCNLKALPPMEGLHSDVNINICNSSASDVPKSTVAVTDRASKTAPMSFANIIKSQHVKKGNFRSLLNAEKVESFDFVLPKYAVDEVKSSSKVERMNEATNDNSLIECEGDIIILCRLATVAYGAASATWMARQRPDDIVLEPPYISPPTKAPVFCGRPNFNFVVSGLLLYYSIVIQILAEETQCNLEVTVLLSIIIRYMLSTYILSKLCSLIDSDPVQEKQKSTAASVKEHDEARIDLRFKKMKKKMSKSQTISNANRPKIDGDMQYFVDTHDYQRHSGSFMDNAFLELYYSAKRDVVGLTIIVGVRVQLVKAYTAAAALKSDAPIHKLLLNIVNYLTVKPVPKKLQRYDPEITFGELGI